MKKVLLVDDEPNIIMALEFSFKNAGYEVFIARDGIEALNILQSKVPDAIILDIMMPNVDGYIVLEKIKENKKLINTKVMFLSAKKREEDIKKGLDMGVDSYETKPFSIKKIINKINEWVSE